MNCNTQCGSTLLSNWGAGIGSTLRACQPGWSKLRLASSVAFLLLLVSLPVMAQKFTGVIEGAVVDKSGAAISGATVTVTNTGTGATRTASTSSSGEYSFPDLPAGVYEVRIQQPNFKEFVSKSVEVHVSSTATVNATLEVGAVSEQVTVEAATVAVETATGTVGNVVEGNEVRELPLNGRSFVQLTQLMPGVSPQANFDSKHKGLEAGVDFSVSGNSSTANMFNVDGVNNNDVGSNRTILVYPSIDAIQEFKILRNSYGPEYGQASGAIVNIITKGGTNQFHGGVFYFGRNDVLNAKDYFNGLNQIPKDKLRRNDFGYNIGGPIVKDKLFFFWSQEWNREIRGRGRSGDVPTAAEKAGDFSHLRTDKTNAGAACDPAPTVGGVVMTNINQVPTGGLSKGGQEYLSMLPDPNVANPVNCNNWAQSVGSPVYWREENIRGDYKIGKTWSIMGRYTQDHWENPFPNTQGLWGDDQFPSIESSWKQPGYQGTVKVTKLLGTTAVNDFQFSYASNRINATRSGTNPGLNDTIIADNPTFFPLSDKLQGSKMGYPGFWGGCGPDCATGSNLWTQAPWHNNQQLMIWKDDFSKVWRNHTFKVGVLVSNNQKNEMVNNESQENAFYWGVNGGAPDTGNGAFNMLWNQIQWGGGESQTNPYSQTRWHDIEPYFGDTWKFRRNLTLEYGFRWSFLRFPYSGPDKISTFSGAAYNPALGSDPCNGLLLPPGSNACAAAGFKGGAEGPNRALKDNNNHAIAPRVGIAWDPYGDGKMAVRAGVGQFFQRERLNNNLQLATNPPFNLAVGYNRAFATPPAPGSLSASGTPGWDQDTSDIMPNTWQWNVTLEREVFRDSKMEVAYVGNRGIHLLTYTDANRIAPANQLAFALSNSNALRPFGAGNWGRINDAFWGGNSNYHALQTLFRTRLKALDAQFAYTWSRSLTNTDLTNSGNINQSSALLDPTNPHLNYGPSQINRPHVFVSNIVYDTPTLVGHNAAVRGVLGGWEMAAILSYATGTSLTVFANDAVTGAPGGISGTGAGQNNTRPNVVPGQGCRAPSGSPKYQWLNPNRYTLIGYQLGTFGNGSIGDCLSPGIANTDFSVYKNFKVKERVTMQFRMEFFNLFNKVQFLGNFQSTTNVTTLYDSGATKCATSNTICSASVNPTFGQATVDKGPREIQYALKINF
ncbi:MAG TPA: carboxypeptidase regulatory-like domain-containing protein [Terriglobales bacterium]|nr:carboxypeptidase regulatory-like domain-containing protein [Terriglobales bacterium]